MRLPLLVLGAALLAAGLTFGIGGPSVTVVNTGLHVEHPRQQAAGLLAGSLGLGLWALGLPRRWMSALTGVAAVAMLGAAATRAAYRLDADDEGIAARGLTGVTRLAWKDVQRVDAGPALLLVWGPGDAQVRVDAGHFTGDQRATLDRIISRRVREAREKAQRQ